MADTKPASRPTNDILAQVADKVRAGESVLIALSNNPSVDEMAAAIGLTLVLDKVGKHATAIFSGQIPNALEFLQPENTFEANTNSLQDFIIALNKEKADHLRYKIEGDYVKVFITPYRTTIDESDLEFSHGDFNIDLVLALNVANPSALDGALSEHGRIMHNAAAVNITAGVPGKFGDLEWNNPAASSVSEMVGMLAEKLDDGKVELVDKAVATAILTGIVAATNRFSNEKTAPSTMVMASKLMEKGADQQLISSNIPVDLHVQVQGGVAAEVETAVQSEDGTTLSIARGEGGEGAEAVDVPTPTGAEAVGLEPAASQDGIEKKLDKVIQPPVDELAGGPLMEELRQMAIQEQGPQMGDLSDNGPKKDYAALIEQELSTPLTDVEPAKEGESIAVSDAAIANNLATQAAPAVPSGPEVNGVPEIDYAQAPTDAQAVVAPTGVEAAPVAAASPLPMPSGEMLPPPPPPPFDPNAGVAVPPPPPVAQQTVPTQQPVADSPAVATPVVGPIQPAAPESDVHAYLGSNPAMQDQVYPPGDSNDPGAFQLPTVA